jgi:hypothetical protein
LLGIVIPHSRISAPYPPPVVAEASVHDFVAGDVVRGCRFRDASLGRDVSKRRAKK